MIEIDGFTFEINQTIDKKEKSVDKLNELAAEKFKNYLSDHDCYEDVIDSHYDSFKHRVDFENLQDLENSNDNYYTSLNNNKGQIIEDAM